MTTKTQDSDWREVAIHFGKKSGVKLGTLSVKDLAWWKTNWQPNGTYCKSQIKMPREYPAVEAFDDGDEYYPAVPARIVMVRAADPVNCQDCALRNALDAAEFITTVKSDKLHGKHVGVIGETVTVTDAVVEKVYEFEREFNRKKVANTVAVFRNGELFKWMSTAMPSVVKSGAVVSMTGVVKWHGELDGEAITELSRCKIAETNKRIPTRNITLFCDAKSSNDAFAVCAATGQVVDYGKCGLGRPDNGDNTDHELMAALRALEIAKIAKEHAGVDCIGLTLKFDAKWMKGMVGKAKPLRQFAKTHNVIVKMEWIRGSENPADEWTTAAGYKVVTNDELATLQ